MNDTKTMTYTVLSGFLKNFKWVESAKRHRAPEMRQAVKKLKDLLVETPSSVPEELIVELATTIKRIEDDIEVIND